MRTLSILTNSSATTFLRCGREYEFRYVRGYRARRTDMALDVGKVTHLGLEAWERAVKENHPAPLDAALAPVMAAEIDPFERARIEAMIAGYHVRWLDAPYDVLEVELEFAIQAPNPDQNDPPGDWTDAGKIDAIVRDRRTGRIYVQEHKTSSEDISPGSEYRDRLVLDSQISTYVRAAAVLGYAADGCIYDVIQKPLLKPLQITTKRTVAETPEEFRARCGEWISGNIDTAYQRFHVTRSDEELRESALDRWAVGGAIQDAHTLGRWPRSVSQCIRFKKRCPFFDVCTRAASLEDPTRFEKLDDPYEELTIHKPKEGSTCNQ